MSFNFAATPDALICGFVLAPSQPGRAITLAEALAWLAASAGATAGEFL